MTAYVFLIQAQLDEIGLDATIVPNDGATWNNVRTDPKAFDLHINLTSSPEGYYGNSLSSAIVLSNSVFYENAEFESLLKTSLGVTDSARQLEINKQLNDIMMKDCPVYAMVNQAWLWSYTAELAGVKEMADIGQRITPSMLYFS